MYILHWFSVCASRVYAGCYQRAGMDWAQGFPSPTLNICRPGQSPRSGCTSGPLLGPQGPEWGPVPKKKKKNQFLIFFSTLSLGTNCKSNVYLLYYPKLGTINSMQQTTWLLLKFTLLQSDLKLWLGNHILSNRKDLFDVVGESLSFNSSIL